MLQRFVQDPAPSSVGELGPELGFSYSHVKGSQGSHTAHGNSSISWVSISIVFPSLKTFLIN